MILAVPCGIAIGLVVGTVGGGGAILALPIFVYLLDQEVGPASTASLIVVVLGASVGAAIHARSGQICWRTALLFSAPAVAGAYAGTVAGQTASGRFLVVAFVPVMLTAAALMWRQGNDPEAVDGDDPDCPKTSPERASIGGLLVGALTGFFGVGGGFLIVPWLTIALGLEIRRAIATSLAVITITGLAALASHLAEGAEPDWPLTIVLAASAACGAALGTLLGSRLPRRVLAQAFGTLLALIAILLLADVLLLGGPPAT